MPKGTSSRFRIRSSSSPSRRKRSTGRAVSVSGKNVRGPRITGKLKPAKKGSLRGPSLQDRLDAFDAPRTVKAKGRAKPTPKQRKAINKLRGSGLTAAKSNRRRR